MLRTDKLCTEGFSMDQEGSLEDHFAQLKRIGFCDTVVIFREARFAGLLTYKNRKHNRCAHPRQVIHDVRHDFAGTT